jgi:cyclopropane-fatty-acyl-phospholipid synthase
MSAATRLASFKKLLVHVRQRLDLDLGFILWDGTTVPDGLVPDALALRIADEGVVAALVRRPKLDTILNLWVTGRLDLRGGTLFDVVARRPKVRTKDFLRALDKRLALDVAARFLFVSRGGPWPLERVRTDAPADGSEGANRDNVQYHYDLSNEFYALFLDPDMVYTCAYFSDWSDDLASAERNKLEMSCRRLRLRAGETLLDIGCGWGAFICYAAQHYGVRAHGVTLAQRQYEYAKERIARLGLQDRVTLELRDYTLVDGSFDKIASIGMFEQVGIDNHPQYFQTVNRLLKPNGLYLHHAISRPAKSDDKSFRKQRPEYAVITRYIFPGGEVDHLGMAVANLERFGFEKRSCYALGMSNLIKGAMASVASLPEATQDKIGEELLSHIDQLRSLRANIDKGVRSLDRGEGRELHISEIIQRARAHHGDA